METDKYSDLFPETNHRHVYSVSELGQAVRRSLEAKFGSVWVEGEVSNCRQPSSGHLYFSLKDNDAQLRCTLFRQHQLKLNCNIKDGMQLRVRGLVSMFVARGDYQLNVDWAETLGSGALQREFEALKQQLQHEGIFDPALKRPIPAWPNQLGIVTSLSTAALQDVLKVLRRRLPKLPIVIYPSTVQGDAAAAELCSALEQAANHGSCDVLLMVRGGGSIEDLWAFNDPQLARRMRTMPMPVVTGIGHQIDITIADLAADLTAATPSAAAEQASPDRGSLARQLLKSTDRLHSAFDRNLSRQQHDTDHQLQRLRLQHPLRRVEQHQQRRDELELRLQRLLVRRAQRGRSELQRIEALLSRATPIGSIQRQQQRTQTAAQRLQTEMNRQLQQRRLALEGIARALSALSPLAILERGYAIVRREGESTPLTHANKLQPNDMIETHLARAVLHSKVTHITTHKPQPLHDD